MELTREEKQTIQKVVEHMGECDLFSGRYDAKNGNKKIYVWRQSCNGVFSLFSQRRIRRKV